MLFGLIFTISSLIYLIILLLVYYSKRYFYTVQGSLYRLMFIACIVFLMFQILSVIAVFYDAANAIIFVLWRVSWSACIVWYCIFLLYFVAFLEKDKSTSLWQFLKSRKLYLCLTIIFALMIVGYFTILPFAGLDANNMTFLPGKTAYLVYVFCLFINLLVIITMIKNFKKLSKIDIIVVSLSIILTIILMVFQNKYISVSIIPIGFAVEMYLLYFSTENPDLLLISNTKKISDDLDKANKVKLDFLSNISYEIKNPMEIIASLTDTLISTPFQEESSRNYLKQICSSSTDLLDITNNILDLSTIETGSNLLKNREYNMADTIQRLVDITRNKLGFSKIKFDVSVDSNMPRIVYGDEAKIYQCLLNVLINAVKYTEIGKINFTVTATREGNDKVKFLFSVMDTGMGIKEEDGNSLFEKFTRLNDAVSKEIEGSGLGLTIAKRYLDLMNGKIWFVSQHLAGSTFYIEVEQKIVDATPIKNINLEIHDKSIKDDFDYSSKKILIIDDNELNIKVIKRLLEKYNLNINSLNDGDKCITAIKSEEKYDLIFMDDSLPNISGTETMKILKKLQTNDLPPIVVVTANTILGMKEQYIKEGFDDYLSKPINIDDLDDIIKKYLRK